MSENAQLAVINNELAAAVGYIAKGNEVYQINSAKLANATNAGNKILAVIGDGIQTPEQLEKCRVFIEKCKEAKKACNTNRVEITKSMTLVSKMFTSIENELDDTNDGSLPNKIKKLMDAKAKADYDAEVVRKEQERIAALTEQEKIAVTETIQKFLAQYVSDRVYARIKQTEEKFSILTLETIDAAEDGMNKWSPVFDDYEKFMANCTFVGDYRNKCLTREACDKMFMLEKNAYFQTAANTYVDELCEYRMSMLQRFIGKRQELIKIAELEKENAAEAELERLAAAQREEARKQKQLEEQAIANAAAQKLVEQQANDKRTTQLFDNSGTVSIPATPAKVKKVVKLLTKEGILPIITKWFTDNKANIDIAELEKKFSFCITHVNKAANAATPEFIINSEVEYVDDVKAKI